MTEITSIPPKNDPIWKDAATGKITKPWQMLALKIMMTRIVNATKADPSPGTIEKSAAEIHEFFEKNLKMAQADLAALLSR